MHHVSNNILLIIFRFYSKYEVCLSLKNQISYILMHELGWTQEDKISGARGNTSCTCK
jgi:hypothetical protein